MYSSSALVLVALLGVSTAEFPPIQPRELQVLNGTTFPTNLVGPIITPRQSSGCGLTYAFTASNEAGTFTSQNYPSNYAAGSACTYDFSSPAGTQMTIQCTDFNVPCNSDGFFLSLSGDRSFADASGVCGTGPFSKTTTGNKLTMFLQARYVAAGTRRYQCTITVTGGAAAPAPAPTPAPAKAPAPAPAPATGSCSCGVKGASTRIVGGTSAATGEFPWRVLLFVANEGSSSGGVCGGTIISPNWILTAAHCTMDMTSKSRINIFYDTLSNPVTTGSRSKSMVADRYIQHPSYSRTTLENDLSLVHVPTPFEFTNTVSPECLPWNLKTETFAGKQVTASGFGTTQAVPENVENRSPPSNSLLKVQLPVLSNAECNSYYQGRVTDNMVCTYLPGKDTCQGDSGGSVDYLNSNGRSYLVGVTSYGVGCAQSKWPGVYVRVTNYLDWIQSNTGETFCKA